MKKTKKVMAMLMATVVCIAGSFSASAYKNSIPIPDTSGVLQETGTCGDPFIMKYDGVYYLYCSTGSFVGFSVWSSNDMLNWKYRGNCGVPTETMSWGAYAPEVTYWNGKFYMYASCGEQIHRLYVSDSPVGPFKYVREITNIIDGNVYIDNDEAASKYFFAAGNNSLTYTTLTTSMLKATKALDWLPSCNINNGWTEGPTLFKRNGKYYMTYTGNHVLSYNYMVEYAMGDAPLNLQEPSENLILANTDGGVKGPGHNSVVIGPNLDSYYICYHDLDTIINGQSPVRSMNIDRMVFNGDKLEVWGPTSWKTENPAMPEFYDYITNNSLTSKWKKVSGDFTYTKGFFASKATGENLLTTLDKTTENYTAEFNLRLATRNSDSKAGGLVSYTDANNYAYAYIKPSENKLYFDMVVDGAVKQSTANLPVDSVYNANSLHNITVKKDGSSFSVIVDKRELINATDLTGKLKAGNTGLKTENCLAYYSFTAFSSAVNGSGDVKASKPTGYAMDAVHANATSRNFTTEKIKDPTANSYSSYYTGITVGDSLTYNINPEKKGYYKATIKAKSTTGTKVDFILDGKTVASDVKITNSGSFAYSVSDKIPVYANSNNLKIKVTEGTLDLYSVKLDLTDSSAPEVENKITFKKLEGAWTKSGDTYTGSNSSTFGKMSYGSESYSDYTVSTDITLKSGTDAGLLARLKYATDTADAVTGIGNGSKGNPNYHYGYYASLTSTGVSLGKQMFGWKSLSSKAMTIKQNTTYTLKVTCVSNNIKVYLDGTLCIDYTDNDQPIITGKVGLRNNKSVSTFANTTITHLNHKSELQ